MARQNTLITVGKGSPFTMYDLWDKRPLINYGTSSQFMGTPASVSYDIPLKQPTDQDFAGLREYADANAARYFKKYNQPGSQWGDLPYYAASAGIQTLDSLANKGASNAVGNTFNTLGDIGMMLPGPYKAIGLGLKGAGFIANGFTNSVNKEYQNLKNNQILNYANTSSNASDYPQLQMDMDDAMTNTVDLGKIGDWGSKGFLSSGSKRRNAYNNAQAALGTATNMRIADINQRGIGINQRNTLGQLGRLSAFGGYIGGALDIMQDDKHIDAINNRSLALARRVNRFPGGGPKESFFDHFKVDPIKAAVDYINSRKAMTNIFEEAEASGKREKEFQDVQKRLAAAETQNQGLQSLLNSQGLTIQNLMNQQLQNNYADNWEQRMNPSIAPNDTAVMAKMRKSLVDRGVDNRAHQDAIIANMMVESSGNPNARNPKSSARGLMQWLTGRQPKAWDWDSQVDHIVNTYNKFGGDNWLDKEAYNKFMNTTDSTEAARLFRRYWERPEESTYNFTDKYINQMYSKKAFGGPKNKKKYEDWFKTVPSDRNDTTNYNLRRAYELAPLEELESWRTSSIKDLVNGENHLRSVYKDPKTGVYEFMKSKNHPTINMELDWFNSNNDDAKEFRKQYNLDTSGDYYKYVPKKAFGGELGTTYSVGDIIDVDDKQLQTLKKLGYEFRIIG